MKPAAVRLLLAAVAFLGWLGYLFYQVQTRPRRGTEFGAPPLVVSRPQVLASDLDVIAFVGSDDGEEVEVEIQEVLYPKEEAGVEPGDKVKVRGLDECRHSGRADARRDFQGAGPYLLPLKRTEKKGVYAVAPVPPSPTYPPGPLGEGNLLSPGPPRIYPATEQAKAQYRQVRKLERGD